MKNHLITLGLLFPVAMISVSCMSSKKEAQLREQIWKLSNKVGQLETLIAQRETKYAYLDKSSDESKRLMEASKFALQEAKSTTSFAKSEIEEIKIRLDQEIVPKLDALEKELMAGGGKPMRVKTAKKPSPEEGEPDNATADPAQAENPKDILDKAKTSFDAKNYDEVVSILTDFEKKHKKVKSMDKVFYYRAESLFILKKFNYSAVDFNSILEKYPKSSFAAQSQMRMGDIYRNLGDKDTAKIYYNEFLTKFTSSKLSQEVKTKLEKMK